MSRPLDIKHVSKTIGVPVSRQDLDSVSAWADAEGDSIVYIDVDTVLESGDAPVWLQDYCEQAQGLDCCTVYLMC
jgi:hypothetical protein